MENNKANPTPGSSDTDASSSKAPKPKQKSLRELISERRRKPKPDPASAIGGDIMDPYEAVNNYKCVEFKKTGFIEQESPTHYCIWDIGYPETPDRVIHARKRLDNLDLVSRCETIRAETFSDDEWGLHTKSHYDLVKNTSQMSEYELRSVSSQFDSVYFTRETYKDAKLAAEAAVTLTVKVAEGKLKNGFALIRPPGHHAMSNACCGYCYMNNVALAADITIKRGLAKKILIVDYDVHHGQGTQQMFYNRNDVLYFSIHRFEHGKFWPNLRESDSDYIGRGPGKGFNVNVPLNSTGLGDSDYLAIVFNLLLPIAYEFNPDLILISAGYDACIGCPEGRMKVTPGFYGHLITLLSGLANGKVVVCLEGGYFLESLAEGVVCTLKALIGDACYPLHIQSNPSVHPDVQEVINNVKFFLHNRWDCFKQEKLFELQEDRLLQLLDSAEEHITCTDFRQVEKEGPPYPTANCYPVTSMEKIEHFKTLINRLREEYLKCRTYNNFVGYVYDEEFLEHKPTSDTGRTPPEKPERLAEIMHQLEEFSVLHRLRKIEPFQFDEILWMEKVHGAEYIHNILSQENVIERPDWYFNPHTTSCIKKCISSILSLAQTISDGAVRSGVALIRPPGHHAVSNRGSGFCFVNNVVIAAEFLIQKERYKRILIVDFDVHHGNGTQELTYKRSDIMYLSLHRYDNKKFFPALLAADCPFTGEYLGEGYNVNIPFNQGSKTDSDYWAVWHRLVLPLAYSYNPDFVIVSAGFDAGIYDPLGGYKITPEMFGHFVHTLKSLAAGKLLLALEGGYHVKTTALSMTMCVKALLGDPLPTPTFSTKSSVETMETVNQVVRTHRVQWPMLQLNKQLLNFACTSDEKIELYNLLKGVGPDYGTRLTAILQRLKDRITLANK